MKMSVPIAKSLLLFVLAVFLIFSSGLRFPYIDKNADTYFSESIKKASVAYGVCRLVNGSVSVIKESQVQMEPAGLGVSLAAGQVLDPLDDMTERASDILVTSIVSLGIQKIAFELCTAFAPPLIGWAILVLVGLSLIRGNRARKIKNVSLKLIIILIVARLCLPVSSILNAFLHDYYFSPQVTEAKDGLSFGSPEFERLKDIKMPEVDGVLGTVTNGLNFVGEKTADLGLVLKAMIENMGSLVFNLLKLSYLYGAIFLVQVLILPIATFWLLARITNGLIAADIPPVRRKVEGFVKTESDVDSKQNTE